MNEKLEKMIKKDKIVLVLGVAFLIALAGCIFWVVNSNKKTVPHFMGVTKAEQGAYLNTKIEPYRFASRNQDQEWLAYVMDEDNYLYIVQLTGNQYKTIEKYFALGEEEKLYEIKGMTKEFDENIIKLAMDTYNEEIGSEDDVITKENFNEYFGYFYLKMGETSDTSLAIVLATISAILGISFIIVGLKSTAKTKKTVGSEEYQRAIEELNNPEYETKNAILTKNYIVYSNCGLNIVNYKDVTWVYRHTYRYNGVPNHSLAYYIRGSKKINLISYGLNQKAVDELVVYIGKKNPNVLVGYTKENIKAHKENI